MANIDAQTGLADPLQAVDDGLALLIVQKVKTKGSFWAAAPCHLEAPNETFLPEDLGNGYLEV